MNDILYLSYTSMDTAARCPRYFYYDRILKIEAESERLGMKFGAAGHVGLHKLYETKSLDDCLRAAEEAWKPFEGMDMNKDGKPGVRTWLKLREILQAYYDQLFAKEEWEDRGGEEMQTISIEIPQLLQDRFLLLGYPHKVIGYRVKIDRKGLSGGVPAIQEWKFLKPLIGTDFVPEPNNQIAGYLHALGAKKAVVTVAKVQVSSQGGMVKGRLKSDEPHSIFTRDPVFYEPHVFEEFKRDVIGWALSMLTCSATGIWQKNAPGACNHYGGCQFKQLCAADPEQRKVLIDLSYRPKPEFNEGK